MDLQDNHQTSWKSRKRMASFRHAMNGIKTTFQEEANFKIHLVVATLIIIGALVLNISKSEWLILILVIGNVLICELFNTAIENVVDLVVDNQWHQLAKKAKDIAAAAVFMMAMVAVVIGIIIFTPYILELIR